MVVNTAVATLLAAASICEQGKFSSPKTDLLWVRTAQYSHTYRELFFLLFFFGIKVSLTSRPKKKGVAFGNVKGILFPSFGIGERGGISVNFGKSNFVYDIKAHNWAVEDPATVPL